MKKFLKSKLLRMLGEWIVSRFKRRFAGESKFDRMKKYKKSSPAEIHLRKVFGILKNRAERKAWAKH